MFDTDLLADPWVWIGAALLLLSCALDFRDRVRRTTSRPRYALALSLFLAFNGLIFLALVSVFVGSPEMLGVKAEGEVAPGFRPLIVLLVAFLYFGAGASRLRILGFELNFYQRLVNLANSALRFSIDRREVRREIFEHEAEYAALQESLGNLHLEYDSGKATAEARQLSEEWQAIENDCALIDSHIEDLKRVREALASDRTGTDHSQLQTDLENREAELRQGLINRLKTHLFSFILVHAKTRDEVRTMLEPIPDAGSGWSGPPPLPLMAKPLPHSILVGLFFGGLVGLVAAAFPSGSVHTPWIGAIACSVFAAIFYLILKTEEAAYAGLIGAAAGFWGFVVWAVLKRLALDRPLDGAALWSIFWASIIGVLYGGASGLLIHLFRTTICPRVHRTALRGLIIGGLGAVVFFAIAALSPWILPAELQAEDSSPRGIALMAVIGALFLVGLANACQLLVCPKKKAPIDLKQTLGGNA